MPEPATVLEFRLPDLGEGLTEAELVSWSVAVGDPVRLNQPIAEVETAKALVELPSPFAGTVAELLVQPGATVPVGTPIIRVTSPDSPPPRQPVLVGYGPGPQSAPRRRRSTSARPDAKPSARKLARELGVEIGEVPGTGHDGAITADDVRSHGPGQRDAAPAARESRTPIAGVRKRTAEAMITSWHTIPQVTEFVTVDVSASMELIEHLRATPSFADLSLTPLALVAKTALIALAEHPALNSSWDEEAGEIVTKRFVNLGIAVATARGLLVPSVKEAHAMSLRELCREIGWLAETARLGDATPADLRGGTFSITNIGTFGIDAGTPIINPGEAAILCLGAVRRQPWVVDDRIVPRWVTTLALSFDHRLVDGEQGSKFLADVAAMLSDPLALIGRI